MRVLLASLLVLSAVMIGCGGDSDSTAEETTQPSEARRSVPPLGAQLFLAERICKHVLDFKHRPSLLRAVAERDIPTLRRAVWDLSAAGRSLGSFPAIQIRAQTASGLRKVAGAIRILRNREMYWDYLASSMDEQGTVALAGRLPACAIR